MHLFKTPQISGEWKHIFDPNKTLYQDRITWRNRNKWYTNDHCVVKGTDGRWHGYGIIGYKVCKLAFAWIIEQNLFHISSKSLYSENWEEHSYALTADRAQGERFAWAPHVIWWQNQFIMLYAVGDLRKWSAILPSYGKIHMATSPDGFNWARDTRNPVIIAHGYARDPYILFTKGEFYVYYTCNYNEIDYTSSIAVRRSKDLQYWTGPTIVHRQPKPSMWFAGDTESPYVIEYDGLYYLFTCTALKKYNCTKVYWSIDPEHFPNEHFVCELPTHASEILHDPELGWFITNTGWDKKGLFIAPLKWA